MRSSLAILTTSETPEPMEKENTFYQNQTYDLFNRPLKNLRTKNNVRNIVTSYPFAAVITLIVLLLSHISSAQAPKSVNPEDYVIAIVGNEIITERDVRLMIPNFNTELQKIPPAQKIQIMREIINQRILASEGRALKLDQSETFKARQRSIFDTALARTTVDHFITNASKIDKQHLKNFYDKNRRRYRDDQVRASHILLKTRKEAEEVLKELKAGKIFAELAKERSIGPSGVKGGDLGFFKRGQMVPAFDSAAFSLSEGATGGPIKTRYGFHIIKVTQINKGKLAPFKEVEAQILQLLVSKKLEKYLKNLRASVKVVIKDPNFAIGGE